MFVDKLYEMIKNRRLSFIYLFCIIIGTIAILLGLSTKKEGMHVDEYYTYGLANHVADGEISISPECGVPLNPSEVFDNYFYAQSFSLKNVWLNQSVDVHPPLYYLIFHIWGLFTHNFLGLKTGILLNIIFHIINIACMYLILKELRCREYLALIGSAFYALNPIILGSVLFIRMYVLLSTFILLLMLLLLKEWKKEKTDKGFYIKLGVISILGTLTHYYFLIYLFFCCCIWGMRLLVKRRWKETVGFVGATLISGGISIAIFPYMLQQIFTGNRGQESVDMLFNSSWIQNLKYFASALDKISGGYSLAIICAAVLFLAYKIASDKSGLADMEICIGVVLLPGIFYFLLVSKIAVMLTTRYISPLYGSWVILIIMLIKGVTDYIEKDSLRCMGTICFIAILFDLEWKVYTWPELYPEAKEAVAIAQEYGAHNECVYVYDKLWESMPSYQEFIQYSKITFIPEDNFDLLFQEHYTSQHNLVIYFEKDMDQEQINEQLDSFIAISPDLYEYRKLYEYGYNMAYYLE